MSLLNQDNVLTFQQEQYPGGPLVPNGLSFQVELTDSEEYLGENIISKYPVARATDRADNLFSLPENIIINGKLRDAFFQGSPVSGGLFQSIENGLSGDSFFSNKLSQVRTSLILCFRTPTTYQVATSVSKAIPSIGILKYRLYRDNKFSNVFQITLDLQQVIIRDSKTVTSSATREYQPPIG
jgi:hypothetical protein